MFDIDALRKLTDAIPADVKGKVSQAVKQQISGHAADLKNSSMVELGLTNSVSEQTSEAAATSEVSTAASPHIVNRDVNRF